MSVNPAYKKTYLIRSRREVISVIRKGYDSGFRNVDVHLRCRDAKLEPLIEQLESSALAHGALVIAPRPGLDRRRVILRFPPRDRPGPPPAGDRSPLNPSPTHPSQAATLDPPITD